MAVLPTKSTVPPTDLTGQQNGNLDLGLLTRIGPGSSLARLHHTIARGWLALAAAALEFGGWTLWWTSVADTYRTYAVQQAVFIDRYKPVPWTTYDATASAHRKIWAGAPAAGYSSIYWVKKNNNLATAATPGTSPHGMGCAIDGALKTDAGVVAWTAALPWLILHARDYGFAWSLQSEPWHIQWVMGDIIPQAVLDYENPPDPPDPPPINEEEDMLNKILIPAFEGVPDSYPHLGAFDSGLVRPLVSNDIAPTHGVEPIEDEGQYRRLCEWAKIPLS